MKIPRRTLLAAIFPFLAALFAPLRRMAATTPSGPNSANQSSYTCARWTIEYPSGVPQTAYYDGSWHLTRRERDATTSSSSADPTAFFPRG